MFKPLVPAALAFRDGVPYSARYGDVYHSADGGAGQARHVFLHGCGLPADWAARPVYSVLETGFGTGLNFLVTWAAWRADPKRCMRLHFCSTEKHPFSADDLASLHRLWPEFAALSTELVAAWPLAVPGFHRLILDGGRVHLSLLLGEAVETLPQLEARIDAFYLDGFSPDCNADLWHDDVFGQCARLARPGARLASYTVAAGVMQALARAGFACHKRAGYGRKKQALTGWFRPGGETVTPCPRSAVVIGAGVAGAAAAHALASRGIAVQVLERGPSPASGASGNPAAVFRPVLARHDNASTRLTRAAFLHNLRAWRGLAALEWSQCGVVQMPRDAASATRTRELIEHAGLPPALACWLSVDEARSLANWPLAHPGVYFPLAGWVVPGSLCAAWLAQPGIQTRMGVCVSRLVESTAGWQVCDDSGAVLAEAGMVVLANAADALRLVPEQGWPVHCVRGQVSCLPAGSLPGLRRVIAREGYVVPGHIPLVGATYEHDDLDLTPREASHAANLARLEAILPGAGAGLSARTLDGRAALRATLPDRLPLLGAVEGRAGVFVAAGYASRGVVWAGVLGEALACLATGEPRPLERDLMRAISPSRFAHKAARGKT